MDDGAMRDDAPFLGDEGAPPKVNGMLRPAVRAPPICDDDPSLPPLSSSVTFSDPPLSERRERERAPLARRRPSWRGPDNKIRINELRRHHSRPVVRCTHPLAQMAEHLVLSPTARRTLDRKAYSQDLNAHLDIIEFAAFCHARHVQSHVLSEEHQREKEREKYKLRRYAMPAILPVPHKRRRSKSEASKAGGYDGNNNKARRGHHGLSPGTLAQREQQELLDRPEEAVPPVDDETHDADEQPRSATALPSQYSYPASHPGHPEFMPFDLFCPALSPNTATRMLVRSCDASLSLQRTMRRAYVNPERHQGRTMDEPRVPLNNKSTAGAQTPQNAVGLAPKTHFSFRPQHVATGDNAADGPALVGVAMSDDGQLAHPTASRGQPLQLQTDDNGRHSAPPALHNRRQPRSAAALPPLDTYGYGTSAGSFAREMPQTPMTPTLGPNGEIIFADPASAGMSPRSYREMHLVRYGFMPPHTSYI